MNVLISLVIIFLVVCVVIDYILPFIDSFFNRKSETVELTGGNIKNKGSTYRIQPRDPKTGRFISASTNSRDKSKIRVNNHDEDIDVKKALDEFHRELLVEPDISHMPSESAYSMQEIQMNLLYLDTLYDKDSKFKSNYINYMKQSHPFEFLKFTVHTPIIGDVLITNAFMKMIEFIKTYIPKSTSANTTLFDIASAPGMFIVALSTYMKSSSFTWDACSYIPKGNSKYLNDKYGVFKQNPEHFHNVNILDKSECENLVHHTLNNKKYTLVTGDVGTEHGYNELQEIHHLDLQWSQAWLALNLVAEHGNIFLKMYSLITDNSMYLINTLSEYFEKLYIWKPQTSRIFNCETYIVGLNRNSKDCTSIPFEREKIVSSSVNVQDIYNYFHNYAKIRLTIVNALLHDVSIKAYTDTLTPMINYISSFKSEKVQNNESIKASSKNIRQARTNRTNRLSKKKSRKMKKPV